MYPKQRKLSGNRDSQLAKLKAIWLKLPRDERVEWQEKFISSTEQRDIRGALLEKFQVNLQWDSQLTSFRDWELEQRELDLEAERQAEDERRFLEEHPEWSLDEAREAVLKKAYLRSTTRGDFRLGLAVVQQENNVNALKLGREKLELLKRKVLQKPTMTPEERQAAIRAIYGRA
jgi:hypothetical protein